MTLLDDCDSKRMFVFDSDLVLDDLFCPSQAIFPILQRKSRDG